MNRLAIGSALGVAALLANPALGQTIPLPAQIAAACNAGGTVTLPPTYTTTTTINFSCPTGTNRVELKGSPTVITCNTGAAPCLVMGSASFANSRPGLTVTGLHLIGQSTAGSEGIQVLQSATQAVINNVRVDNFDKGMHFLAPSGGLLWGNYVSNLVIGFGNANPTFASSTVNVAVHLDGPVANIKFVNFELSATQRVILADGPASSGAGASFSSGSLNMTTTPGTAAVYVDSSDASVHELLLSNIEDWETACPYLEVGRNARVVIDGLAFNGDPQNSGNQPGFRMLPNTVSWLRVSNALMVRCSGATNVVSVESPTSFVAINGSDIVGGVSFTQPASGTFVGNRCNLGVGLTGTLTNVRASANLGAGCSDR